jgi:hypothetical protein
MDELNSNVEKLDITNEVEPIVKRKKGRPRKDATIQNVPKNPEEKKKRGRKKKEVVVEEIKQKKKRGRKAAVKYFSSSIRKKIPLTTVLQDNNNYILHLDVKDDNNNDDNDNINDGVDACNDDNINKGVGACNDGNVKLCTESDKMHIDGIFEQLQKENDVNLNELQKEYDELLEKEDSIISEINNNEDDLTELYERRIEYREHQDNQLINKLEILHKDSNLIDKILGDDKTNTVQTEINEKDDYQEENRRRGYFELLRDFVKNEDWLYKTDVCCWWCCHSFDSVPIGIPEKYDQLLQKFHVKGVFCSFSCMIAYKNETKSGYLKEYLIKYLYSKITGTLLLDANLQPAPPRCTLKMFGGELSIEEFRNSFKENRIYKMIEYPMFVSKDYIEEVDIQNVKRVNQNVFTDNLQQKVSNLDNKRIEDARIRLSQLEKTTITLGNTIDKFIKIT